MDFNYIEALVELMKKHKVRSLKIDGIELSLSNAALYYNNPNSNDLPLDPDTLGDREANSEPQNPEGKPPSAKAEDEDMYWSAD